MQSCPATFLAPTMHHDARLEPACSPWSACLLPAASASVRNETALVWEWQRRIAERLAQGGLHATMLHLEAAGEEPHTDIALALRASRDLRRVQREFAEARWQGADASRSAIQTVLDSIAIHGRWHNATWHPFTSLDQLADRRAAPSESVSSSSALAITAAS